MAKARRRKASRKRKGGGVAGLDFITALGGEVFTCTAYGKGPKGKIRCKNFRKGKGKPSTKARKRAGVKGKYRYNATKAKKWRKKRGKLRAAFGTRSSGVNGLAGMRRRKRRSTRRR